MNASKTIKAPLHDRVISAISGVALAITLVAVGFIACAAFDTPTRMLSRAFSNYADSPYTQEELTAAAVAVKHYAIDTNDRYELYTAMEAVAHSAAADGRLPENLDLYALYIDTKDTAVQDSTTEAATTTRTSSISSSDVDSYALDIDALSHLDDVYKVIGAAKPALYAAALLAYVGCIAVAFRCGLRTLAGVLTHAAQGVLLLFVLFALWAAVGFNSFFTAFHSLFFADGTWTFPQDSLLICMYPIRFWIGMGLVWLLATVAACLICLMMGNLLKKRGNATVSKA